MNNRTKVSASQPVPDSHVKVLIDRDRESRNPSSGGIFLSPVRERFISGYVNKFNSYQKKKPISTNLFSKTSSLKFFFCYLYSVI